MSSLIMEVTNDGILVTQPSVNNSTVTKLIDVEDLSRALAKTAQMETGLLPRGCRLYSKSGSQVTIIIEASEHMGRINFTNGRHFDVIIPYTLFIFKLHEDAGGYVLQSSKCYSMKGPLIDEYNTDLYVFPYGNVGWNGDICWGSIRLPKVSKLNGLITFVEIFFGSIFNGDLSGGSIESFTYTPEASKKPDLMEIKDIQVSNGVTFLAYMEGKEAFPYDKLKRSIGFKQMMRGVGISES